MFSAIDSYSINIKELPKSIREVTIFSPQLLSFGKARKLCAESKDKNHTVPKLVNVEEEQISWKCRQLGIFEPEQVTNSIFWLLIQHFGLGKCQKDFKINDFLFCKG